MSFRVQIRRDPSGKWLVNNPILLSGEFGYETDTTYLKIGDGATPWNYLPYWEGGLGPVGPTGPAIGGTQCIVVSSFGTASENGIALQTAYNEAKTVTPNGLALSSTNRVTLVLTSGKYTPPTIFTVDTQYIDIVSLTGNRDVILTNGIAIRANDVYIKGIDVLTNAFDIGVNTNYPLLKCENCRGGDRSFGGDAYYESIEICDIDGNCYDASIYESVYVSGTFIKCEGGNSSFGGSNGADYVTVAVSGTFIDCKAISGFGLGGGSGFPASVSGLFTNCKSENEFSTGDYNYLTGTFIDCKGGDFAFGYIANGVFKNCEGGDYSFGGYGTAYGIFTDCTAGEFSFGRYGDLSGEFMNCTAGNGSFCGQDISGTLTNCNGGTNSFSGNTTVGAISGKFLNCTGLSNSFKSAFTNGNFTGCIGGTGSFGVGIGVLSGKLYYCRLTAGTFPTVSSGGRTIYCIDGNNNTNNQ
jgi:hypothetical protein